MMKLSQATLLVVSLLALAGCARPDTTGGTGKLSDVFATPDWANFSNTRPTARRPITPDDLVTADGRCTGNPEPAATTDGAAANTPNTTSEALAGQGALPTLPGGVALGMTECQVVQRAGFSDRVDIAAEGTERVTTITVMQGPSPGLYRFRGGRLVSIERVEVPAAARPAKAAKPKAASQKQPPLRGSQQ